MNMNTDFETKELLFYHYIKISNISKKLNLLWVVRDRIIERNFWRILWKMSGKKRQKWASYHYKRFNFLVIKEHKKYKKKLRKNSKIWSLKSQLQQVKKGGISLFLNGWLWDILICFLFFYWFIELSCVYFDTYIRSPKDFFSTCYIYICFDSNECFEETSIKLCYGKRGFLRFYPPAEKAFRLIS